MLEAGDAFQGSLFFTAYSGQAEAEMLNRIGLDAMVYGNHEFDLGPEPLAKFIETADFPVVSGSVDVSADNLLAPLALDHLVLEVGGEKVAILGATTPDTAEISTPGPTVSFRAPVDYLRGEVAALEAEGVDKIILLSHLGTFGDEAVAAAVPGIDLIVGGHATRSTPTPPRTRPSSIRSWSTAPTATPSPSSRPAPTPSTSATSPSPSTTPASSPRPSATPASSTPASPPTPTRSTRIEELAGPIEELKARIVTEIPAGIDGSRETCRAQECPMGDLVTDAMVDRVKGQGVTIGLTNGGGLRASIGAGTVTMGDVLAVLPFQNTLSTFNIPGSGIVAALENGVSQVEEGAGRFPQVSGLRFSWDPKAPADEPHQVRRGARRRRLGRRSTRPRSTRSPATTSCAPAATATSRCATRPPTPTTTAPASRRCSPTSWPRTRTSPPAPSRASPASSEGRASAAVQVPEHVGAAAARGAAAVDDDAAQPIGPVARE